MSKPLDRLRKFFFGLLRIAELYVEIWKNIVAIFFLMLKPSQHKKGPKKFLGTPKKASFYSWQLRKLYIRNQNKLQIWCEPIVYWSIFQAHDTIFSQENKKNECIIRILSQQIDRTRQKRLRLGTHWKNNFLES